MVGKGNGSENTKHVPISGIHWNLPSASQFHLSSKARNGDLAFPVGTNRGREGEGLPPGQLGQPPAGSQQLKRI